MPVLTWDATFDTGIQEFDAHHRHLVDLLNKTYDDFVARGGEDTVATVLDELIDYATYHFAAEEQWMDQCEYRWTRQHCEEHARFTRRVSEIQKDFHNGHSSLSLEVLSFLKNWLIDHILVMDAEYGQAAKKLLH